MLIGLHGRGLVRGLDRANLVLCENSFVTVVMNQLDQSHSFRVEGAKMKRDAPWWLSVLGCSLGACITAAGGGGKSVEDLDVSDVNGLAFALDTFEEDSAATGTGWGTDVDKGGLGTRASFELVPNGAVTKGNAGHFHGALGANRAPWPWAAMSLNWKVDYAPVDLSSVRAVSFWAKGDGKRYKLKVDKAAATDFAQYEMEFVADSSWKQVVIPFDELEQPSWGKKVEREFSDTRQLQFAPVEPAASFDLYVDDLQLLVDPAKQAKFPWPLGAGSPPAQELALADLEKRSIDYRPVSLDGAANRSFQDDVANDAKGGWTDQGPNSVYGFPVGHQKFLGVPFDIPTAPGKQVVVLRGKDARQFPTSAKITVGAKGKAVYFLHASAWHDLKHGGYTVNYADGSHETVALRDGKEIFDFWTPDASPYARTAWTGKNPEREVGLTLFAWANPKPDTAIESIVANTPGDGAYLMLAGITVASDGPFLPPAPAIRFDTKEWFAYEGINVAERRGTALDMSSLLEAPAGKHGFLTRKGEDFVFADGTKIKFWGTSITDLMNAPSHEQADFIAELCAQLGINLTRHHLMDAAWSTGHNIFQGDQSTQELDPDYLDRMDYLLAQLQKRGIYQNLDFVAQRKPFAADGIHDADQVQPGYKMVGEFDEQAMKNQERLIRQLLSHTNKYTGKRYADEPSIVMTAINNESTLFFLGDWGQGELKSPYHRKLLQQLFNEWLKARIGDRKALESRWTAKANDKGKLGLAGNEDPASGSVQPIMDFSDRGKDYLKFTRQRVQDNYRFLYDLETKYQRRMYAAIRGAGYKGLITHTNHWLDVPIHQYVNATSDWNDTHVYWAIPSVGYQYKAGTTFEPKPAIREADSLIARIAARRVKGMPHLISEWHSCHPLWRNDAQLMMAGYSGLQNWSGLEYGLGGNAFSEQDQRKAKLDNVFELAFQASTLALWPATATMVIRRDVKEAPQDAYRPVSHDEVFDPASRVKLPTGLPYVTKSGMAFTGDKASEPNYAELLSKYVTANSARSVTGELATNWKQGTFTVDTPRSQGAAGFFEQQPVNLSNLSASLKNAFVTIVATSLDGAPIAESKHILITAVGNTINTDMELAANGASFRKGGKSPILVEPMLGSVTLRGLKRESAPKVYFLSMSGKRRGEVPADASGDAVRFELLAKYKSAHYEVVR